MSSQVAVIEEQKQETAVKSEDENKPNDPDPSPTETDPSNGKADTNDASTEVRVIDYLFGNLHLLVEL